MPKTDGTGVVEGDHIIGESISLNYKRTSSEYVHVSLVIDGQKKIAVLLDNLSAEKLEALTALNKPQKIIEFLKTLGMTTKSMAEIIESKLSEVAAVATGLVEGAMVEPMSTAADPRKSSSSDVLPSQPPTSKHEYASGTLPLKGPSPVIKVTHIAQAHRLPFGIEASDVYMEKSLRSQLTIAKLLQDNKTTPVLLEGLTENSSDFSGRMAGVARHFFPRGVPESLAELNKDQKKFLYEYGAARTLHFLGVIQTLNRSIHPGQSEKIDRLIKAGDYSHINVPREIEAMSCIAEVISEKKTDNVFLIYGGAHDFSPYCTKHGYEYYRIDTTVDAKELKAAVASAPAVSRDLFPRPKPATLTPEIIEAVRVLDREEHRRLIADWVKTNKNGVDSEGRSILHHAVLAGKPKLVKYLLDKGVGKDARDNTNFTPLILAAQEVHSMGAKRDVVLACMRELLEVGAQVISYGVLPRVAVNLAALNGDLETLKLLESYGASLNDDAMGTPLWWASKSKFDTTAVTAYLESKGCTSRMEFTM